MEIKRLPARLPSHLVGRPQRELIGAPMMFDAKDGFTHCVSVGSEFELDGRGVMVTGMDRIDGWIEVEFTTELH